MPKKPMPSDGKPAASTALPQPVNVSQNVPKNSAPARRFISMKPSSDSSFRLATLAQRHSGPRASRGRCVGSPGSTAQDYSNVRAEICNRDVLEGSCGFLFRVEAVFRDAAANTPDEVG